MQSLIDSLLIVSRTTIDWGSVPDWVAGLGTVLAVVVAGGALLNEARNRRSDELLRDRERRDAEASQARGVINSPVELVGGNHLTGITTVKTNVTNHSQEPILDVAAAVIYEDPNFASTLSANADNSIDFIDPGQTMTLFYTFHEPPAWPSDRAYNDFPQDRFARGIVYTDAQGLRWSRAWNLQPERVLGEEIPPYVEAWHRYHAKEKAFYATGRDKKQGSEKSK